MKLRKKINNLLDVQRIVIELNDWHMLHDPVIINQHNKIRETTLLILNSSRRERMTRVHSVEFLSLI